MAAWRDCRLPASITRKSTLVSPSSAARRCAVCTIRGEKSVKIRRPSSPSLALAQCAGRHRCGDCEDGRHAGRSVQAPAAMLEVRQACAAGDRASVMRNGTDPLLFDLASWECINIECGRVVQLAPISSSAGMESRALPALGHCASGSAF